MFGEIALVDIDQAPVLQEAHSSAKGGRRHEEAERVCIGEVR